MGRLGLAFSTFFKILGNQEFADSARELAKGAPRLESKPEIERPKPRPEPAKPKRSEALTLLAALQREARLVDFLQEDLSEYDDSQVGAAARDVHRGGQQVLKRMFELKPLRSEGEGAEIEVPKGFDAGALQLVGRVEGEPPFRGRLNHHGWVANKLDLPVWSGSETTLKVVAPAEVEVS